MNISSLKEFDHHEMVSFVSNPRVGLRAWISIHNTSRGPATGGTRYAVYGSEEDALCDALRLSRAMTYKCALAGVPYGGGKAVILANSKVDRRGLFQAYARAINVFGGQYTTGEDVGVGEHDIAIMRRVSRFVNGRAAQAGDLGPWAALGVFRAMEAAARKTFGSADFYGRRVAVKGLGKLGGGLCRLLSAAGAEVIGADRNPNAVTMVRRAIPRLRIVSPDQIHKERADIYSPCALGGEFTHKVVRELRASVVCGGANNQLAVSEADRMLWRRNILYIPDYVANAGGLIAITGEMDRQGWSRDRVTRRINHIGATTTKIVEESFRRRCPTGEVADAMARKIFSRSQR